MTCFLDDHQRKNYKPHSTALYALNMLVNFVPGILVGLMVGTCLLFPSLERYMPKFNPWTIIGLEELPLEQRGEYPDPNTEPEIIHLIK